MIGLALLCAFTPEQAVRQAVAAHESVSVEDVYVGALPVMAGAPVEADWTVDLPEAVGLCGSVPMVLTAEGRRHAIRAPITVWHTAPVATAPVTAGQRVPLGSARVSCESLHGETPVDPGRPYEARVAFAAGAPVTTARVRAWPDVEKGAEVRIVAAAGRLTVAAPGELLQDAYTGRPVAVLNLATHAVLTGTYTGNNVVKLAGP